MRPALVIALLLTLPGGARAGEPMRGLAERLSVAARRAGVARVAVLPLEARGAAGAHEGEALADLLMERIVRGGGVKVVERSRLGDVLAERRLGAAGATAAGGESRLAAAEAVVTGSFSRRGTTTRAAVRLVHASSGEVLAAVEETFEWEAPAEDAPGPDGSWSIVVPAPQFTVDVPDIDADPLQLRDAPNDESCADAAARVDRIVAGILEIKARYWASELRKGFSPYAVTRNPGSEISDPALKSRFYDAMKDWFHKPFVPDLTRAQFERMRREDALATALASRCGV